MGLAAELIYLIITNLSANDDFHTLTACNLVSRACVYASRSVLFREICLSDEIHPFKLRARSRPKEDTYETFRSLLYTSPELAPFIKRLYFDADSLLLSYGMMEQIDLSLLERMKNLEEFYIFGSEKQTAILRTAVMQSPQFPSLRQIIIFSIRVVPSQTESHMLAQVLAQKGEYRTLLSTETAFLVNDLAKWGLDFPQPQLGLQQARFMATSLSQQHEKNSRGSSPNRNQSRWRSSGFRIYDSYTSDAHAKVDNVPIVESINKRIEHLDVNANLGVWFSVFIVPDI
jgi:hypothetical protein